MLKPASRRWILTSGLRGLAVVVLLLAAVGGFALCFHRKFSPDPPSNNFRQPASALEAQRQDIEQFSRLLAMDPSFSPAARADANRRIASLKSEPAPLDRERFHVALLRIAALADNGHTNLYYPQTFSAAITTVAFVKQAAGSRAIILGEPIGDRLTFYGEGNSGCEMTFADYTARRDPVLDRAIARAAIH
jgi:hypothetical protein